MFETLRKMIVPIIVIVLLFFVAMIVLEWGLDITGRQKGTTAADAGSVNGEVVSWTQYQQAYNNLLEQESQGGAKDVSESRTKELEQSAWQQLVLDRLIMQEAAKHNIIVTDQEVFAYLVLSPPQYMQSVPAFQTNGKFDYDKYKQAMADPKASPFWAQIEPGVRTDILRLKTQEMIIQTAQVSEPEVKEAFLDEHEKVKVGFINVPYAQYVNKVPIETDQELQTYYDQHKDDYKMDERASIKIAMLEKRTTEEDWQQTRAKLQTIYDSVKAGVDFAEMAKNYSEDNSASKGGDLGWFGQGAMVPEFDKVAFSLKEGEVSEPFRTQFGWHIIKQMGYRNDPKFAGKKGTAIPREAHVAHILLRATPSQASLDALYQKLQDFKTAAAENGFDQTAATDTTIKVQTPPPFTRSASIPFLGVDAAASAFAFNNPANAISDVLENNSAYYVIQVISRLPAGIAPFSEVRSQVSRDIRNQKLAVICHDTAAAVCNAVKGAGDMQAAAKRFGLQYMESDIFNRNGYIQVMGRDPNAIGAAFAMTTVGQTIGPVDHGQGSVVMRLLDRQAADLTLYNEKRDSILTAVRNAKQQELYGRWVDNLMKNSKIENNVDKANRASM